MKSKCTNGPRKWTKHQQCKKRSLKKFIFKRLFSGFLLGLPDVAHMRIMPVRTFVFYKFIKIPTPKIFSFGLSIACLWLVFKLILTWLSISGISLKESTLGFTHDTESSLGNNANDNKNLKKYRKCSLKN